MDCPFVVKQTKKNFLYLKNYKIKNYHHYTVFQLEDKDISSKESEESSEESSSDSEYSSSELITSDEDSSSESE